MTVITAGTLKLVSPTNLSSASVKV